MLVVCRFGRHCLMTCVQFLESMHGENQVDEKYSHHPKTAHIVRDGETLSTVTTPVKTTDDRFGPTLDYDCDSQPWSINFATGSGGVQCGGEGVAVDMTLSTLSTLTLLLWALSVKNRLCTINRRT